MTESLSKQPDPKESTDFFHWICTKNPFYAISAALVLWGLWISFGNQTEDKDIWLLMAGLAGYTLLLAGTAFVLVRFLHVWDDARTVLLLVVLMFLATSVTFDHVLVVEPERGTICYLLGLALSVVISETLLRTIHLRLPRLYRLPYYGLLTLFFLYPIFVRALLDPEHPVEEPVMWGLFGFSTAAGLVFLTLLPALHRGSDYVRDNGSPWPWPLYPWSLFGMLAIAVPGRAVLLCWSLHPLPSANYDRLVFGPFFLVPFALILGVILLEMGVVLSQKMLTRIALFVPLVMIGLAVVGNQPWDPIYRTLRVLTVSIGSYRAFDAVRQQPDDIYAQFLEMFSARLGADPLFLTLILAICFYAYAAWRRVPWATEGLTVALAALALIATNTMSEGLLLPPEPGPLLVPALLQLFLGFRRRSAWSFLFAAGCLAGAIALAVPLPEDMPEKIRSGIFIHLMLVALFVLGALFTDLAGLVMRRLAACLVLLLSLAVMHQWVRLPDDVLPWAPVVYPLVMGILLGVYGQLLHHSFSLVIATVILGYWLFTFGWSGYRKIRGLLKGFDYIMSGIGFFVLAVLVSLAKAGTLKRWFQSRWTLPSWLRPALVVQSVPTPSPQAIPPQQPEASTKREDPDPGH
jgi:hypothetical protein